MQPGGRFWQGCWSARSVGAVHEVKGYRIELFGNLQGADLAGGDFIRPEEPNPAANLWGAKLQGADLSGANLSGANFGGANLTRAKADAKTTWPEGFDPKAAGVTFT